MSYISREFYEQTHRSAVLRDLSIEALKASREVVAGELPSNEGRGALLDIDASLAVLGVEPGMHTIQEGDPDRERKKTEMAANPVLASEWIAGQLRENLIGLSALSTSSADALAEHDGFSNPAGTLHLVETHRLGPKQRAFMMNWELIGALSGFLDEESGPSRIGY